MRAVGLTSESGSGVVQVDGSATPVGPLRAGGTGAPPRQLVAAGALLLFLVALLVFGAPLAAAAPPTVTIDPNPTTTATTAQVSGEVDPQGEEAFIYVEYATGPTGPFTFQYVQAIPAGTSGATSIAAEVTELEPGTEYFFRLNAEVGGVGATYSSEPNPSATTQVIAPAIDSTGVSGVTASGATLEATVRPNGAVTTTHFEYLTEAAYLADGETFGAGTQSTPESAPIGPHDQGHLASASVAGLDQHTAYVFRAVATNEVEAVAGPVRAFTTFGSASTGLSLPDGRAYEQATPVNKNGANAQGYQSNVMAASDGDGITFYSQVGFPGAEGAQNFGTFLATRAPDGSAWSTQGLLPPARTGTPAGVNGWDESLSDVYDSAFSPGQRPTFYLRESATRSLRPIAEVINEFGGAFAFAGASANGSAVVFENSFQAAGTNGLEFASNVYLWDKATGHLSLGGVLNKGQPPAGGAFAGSYDWFGYGGTFGGGSAGGYYTQADHVIANDGSRLFFTAAETGQLYLRLNPTAPQSPLGSGEECTVAVDACTVRVSAPEAGVTDPNGEQPAAFMSATPDGRYAFFTSPQKLTTDATTGPADEGNDLYRYDTESGGLVDLSVGEEAPAEPNGAEVKGILGASADGSYVYFAAAGALPGTTAPASTCSGVGQEVTGLCNLYLWHDGTVVFVTQLDATGSAEYDESDRSNWRPNRAAIFSTIQRTARVSADGETLLFSSRLQLGAFENHNQTELYRYRVGDPQPSCVSCNPSGTAPIDGASLFSNYVPGGGTVPYPPAILNRNLSASGNRVFFESPDKLVAGDVNGDNGCPVIEPGTSARTCQDVYEWEAPDAADPTDTCTVQSSAYVPSSGGCLYLISTGTSPRPSFLADADAEGKNVFFFTSQPLVAQDRDQLVDIYDARVGGGIAAQNVPPPTNCAEERTCKGTGSPPPSTPSAGTTGFHGSGNADRAGRCSVFGHRAKKLSHRARKLSRHAKQVGNHRRSQRMHRKAGHLGKRAKHASHKAKVCRRSNKGAGR